MSLFLMDVVKQMCDNPHVDTTITLVFAKKKEFNIPCIKNPSMSVSDRDGIKMSFGYWVSKISLGFSVKDVKVVEIKEYMKSANITISLHMMTEAKRDAFVAECKGR